MDRTHNLPLRFTMHNKLHFAVLATIGLLTASYVRAQAEQPVGYFSPTSATVEDYKSKMQNPFDALDACFILFTKKSADGTTVQYAIDKLKYKKGELPRYNRLSESLDKCIYDQSKHIETCGEAGGRWYNIYEPANGLSYYQFTTDDYGKLIQAISTNRKSILDIFYLQKCPFEDEMSYLASDAGISAESDLLTINDFSSNEWGEFKKKISDFLSTKR